MKFVYLCLSAGFSLFVNWVFIKLMKIRTDNRFISLVNKIWKTFSIQTSKRECDGVVNFLCASNEIVPISCHSIKCKRMNKVNGYKRRLKQKAFKRIDFAHFKTSAIEFSIRNGFSVLLRCFSTYFFFSSFCILIHSLVSVIPQINISHWKIWKKRRSKWNTQKFCVIRKISLCRCWRSIRFHIFILLLLLWLLLLVFVLYFLHRSNNFVSFAVRAHCSTVGL